MNRCSQFLLLSLRDYLQGKHQQILSLREVLIALVVLRQPCEVIHEIFELILPCIVLPLQGEPAILRCLILESLLCVSLG